MEIVLVVAIIRRASLEAAERGLREMGVRGITVTRVKGYGEYADFLASDHLVEQVKIEAFAPRDRAELIANAILQATGSGVDEVAAILPVDIVFGGRGSHSENATASCSHTMTKESQHGKS